MIEQPTIPLAPRRIYAGIFLLSLVTLMFEILLTRIFSVLMWYHFAFLAISVAMFGMAAGSMLVYLRRQQLEKIGVDIVLARSGLVLSIAITFSMAIAVLLPQITAAISLGLAPFLTLGTIYVVVAIPFFFSGVGISLILCRYSKQVSSLYAADLLGAAIGCLVLMILLSYLNSLTAVFIIALLAALASLCFSQNCLHNRRGTWLWIAILAALAAAHSYLPASQFPLMRLTTIKFRPERDVVFEKWNAYSRLTVVGNPQQWRPPFVWGPSRQFRSDQLVHRLMFLIDGFNGTVMTEFHGSQTEFKPFREDLVNIAHMMRPGGNVMVIGVGGGRDILSALAFGQKNVVAVEINDAVLRALNDTFGQFSGHLNSYPQVHMFNDEARSFLAHSKERFDIIQISLIDTAAATAAGGFVLTENSLYTTEGWRIFLTHLQKNGILTISRWYHSGLPAEAYRLAALGTEALQQLGIREPDKHIMMASSKNQKENYSDVATICVSPLPFSTDDVDRFRKICSEKGFNVVCAPGYAEDAIFKAILYGNNPGLLKSFPLQLSAPTDDNPYFFQMLKLGHAFDPLIWERRGRNNPYEIYGNMLAVIMLAIALILSIILTLACILVPVFVVSSKKAIINHWPLSILFACLGFGFIFIETTQMQRFILLLGHPIYGLSVILFSLLLSAGAGSYATSWIKDDAPLSAGKLYLIAIPLVLTTAGFATPWVVTEFQTHSLIERIAVSWVLLAFMGFAMGTAFPLSMRVANKVAPELTAWLWGINGATSVCASILAVAISFSWGISVSFWAGCAFYVLAFLTFVQLTVTSRIIHLKN